MKMKGVSTLEQQVEKIVLVAVSAGFLIVIAVQFLVDSRIKVGPQDVPPGRAYDVVAQKAREAAVEMDPSRAWTPPTIASSDLSEKFRVDRQAPVAPGAVRLAIGVPAQFKGGADIIGSRRGDAPIAEPQVPPTTRPVAHSFWGTIDPATAVSRPGLLKLLPAAQPFDKVAVSVEAVFDGTALFKSLQRDPDGDAGLTRAIPLAWFRDTTQVFAVAMEREERTGDGEWTNLTDVPAAPGLVDLRADTAKTVHTALDLSHFSGEARRLAEDVQRPAYYRLVAGDPWLPPSEARALAAGQSVPPEVSAQFRRLDQKRDDLKRAQIKLDNARKNAGGRPPQGPGAGDIIGNAPPRNPGAGPSPQERALAAAEKSVKGLTDEVAAMEKSIVATGYDPVTKTKLPPPERGTEARRLPALLEDPGVRVWAHDVTAEPGKTYRYRVRIVINNPVFGRAASLVAEQQGLASRALVAGEPSEWSEPVGVLDDEYYFITSASEGDAIEGSPRASAELYRMFYGFYRRGTTGVEPGDPLAAGLSLPDSSKLLIWDLSKFKVDDPENAGVPVPLQADPRVPPGGGGETIIMPGPGGVPPPPAPANPDQPAALPEGAKPWTTPIRIALNVILVDAGAGPLAGDLGPGGRPTPPKPRAYLRDGGGALIVRVPDEERTSPLYVTVSGSAKKGETQGEPPKPIEDDGPRGPSGPDTPKPPGGPGGGGGGGGGG
ncbi:MAG: hypothetical protein ACKVU4_03420 [Phycisphaerales bacterium]